MERTMLQDLVQSTEPLPIDDLPSPLSAQILEFHESELFSETLQNSDVASNSNCCYEEQSSYPTHQSFNQDMNEYTYAILMNDEPPDQIASTTMTSAQPLTSYITSTDINHINYSVIFDSTEDNENDITDSIDFNNATDYTVTNYLDNQQNQFDYSVLSNITNPIIDVTDRSLPHYYPMDLPLGPLMGPSLPPVYEEDCLSMPPYTRLATSMAFCALLDPTIGPYLPGSFSAALTADNPGILPGGCLFLGTELHSQELDFLVDSGGILGSDTMQRVCNLTSELQAISNESQHLVNGGANSTSLAPEISSLEDPSFKVGKLTAEERREKIHRYMKKRNERNFSKKIKYVCRKTLADSRPRVRGRFAKNDELEMMPRTIGSISNHEEDTDEDVHAVKDEDDMVNSSDIFAHISGVNSFKCNNPLQSWI